MAKNTTTESDNESIKSIVVDQMNQLTQEGASSTDLESSFALWNKGRIYLSGIARAAKALKADEADINLAEIAIRRIDAKLTDIETQGELEEQLRG